MNRKEPNLFEQDIEDNKTTNTADINLDASLKQDQTADNLTDNLTSANSATSNNSTNSTISSSSPSNKANGTRLEESYNQSQTQNSNGAYATRREITKSTSTKSDNPFADQPSFGKDNPFGVYESDDKNAFNNNFASKKPARNSGGFLVILFIALAFAGLISLAFWQWGNNQKHQMQIEKLQKTLEQVASDVSFIDESSDTKTISLQESLNKLNKNITSLNANLKKQKSVSDKNYTRINNLEKSLDKANAKTLTEFAQVNKDFNSLKNTLAKLANNIANVQSQADSLKQADSAFARQLKGIINNVNEVSIEAESINSKLSKISIKDIRELKTAKSAIEEELRSLKITSNRLTRQIESLLKAQK